MKISKRKYIQVFFIIVVILGVIRWIFPSVAEPRGATVDDKKYHVYYSVPNDCKKNEPIKSCESIRSVNIYGNINKHPIYSVPSYKGTFPDNNDVQLIAANRNGVKPVQNRTEAEHRKNELVYVGSNPYFFIDRLNSSIPYLVPKAAVLLQDIGQAYFDSLYLKGIPLHKIIVTSVLRTKDDVQKLRSRNTNATDNSCHLYGTTFDICYNRYQTIENPVGPERRKVRNDTLKWVLSEVLRDFRVQGRCYIKYEVKQGCFHLTVN